ncbi:MAG: hypothetical protein ACK4MX_02375 [Thermaurantiacus sp.]
MRKGPGEKAREPPCQRQDEQHGAEEQGEKLGLDHPKRAACRTIFRPASVLLANRHAERADQRSLQPVEIVRLHQFDPHAALFGRKIDENRLRRNIETQRKLARSKRACRLLLRRDGDRRPPTCGHQQRAFPGFDGIGDFSERDGGGGSRRDDQDGSDCQALGNDNGANQKRKDPGEQRAACGTAGHGQDRRYQWRTTFGISI